MLTMALAKELAPMRILVNAVAPGVIKTPGAGDFSETLEKTTGITKEKMEEDLLKRIPIGRFGLPDEIAKVILFLTSSAADYITGQVIVADGGLLLD